MQGGLGSDTYVVDNLGDQVIEAASAGSDWVEASISYTLADPDVENPRLTGFGATNGTGNAAANHIDGNTAAHVLMGLAGDALFHASAGNDTVQGGTGIFNEGRALAFPCDAEGHVPMDELSDRALNNYLYARAVVGREFARPEIRHAG